jgi:hypothetical protein
MSDYSVNAVVDYGAGNSSTTAVLGFAGTVATASFQPDESAV